jgi:hypothetical protein
MFIQVIQGKVGDEAGLRRNMDRWQAELMPGATGYLGTTAGFTDDGTFVALARFESPDAARANSERPEQGAWWSETEKCFAGDVSFVDCDNVHTWLAGGSDDAGFVQIMRGHSGQVEQMHEFLTEREQDVQAVRPEIIGGLMMSRSDGQWVEAIYFTDEHSARAGEQKELPAELQAELERGMQLMGEVTYLDLRQPILVSPSA